MHVVVATRVQSKWQSLYRELLHFIFLIILISMPFVLSYLGGILSCERRLYSRTGRIQRVLQPTASLGTLHDREYHGSVDGRETHNQDQRQYLAALHLLSDPADG